MKTTPTDTVDTPASESLTWDDKPASMAYSRWRIDTPVPTMTMTGMARVFVRAGPHKTVVVPGNTGKAPSAGASKKGSLRLRVLRFGMSRDDVRLEQPERLRTDDANPDGSTLSAEIQRLSRHPKLRYGERLGKRLEQLYAVAREAHPEQAPPSLASLKALTAFLVRHPELNYPQVTLTPGGDLTAEWSAGRGKLLSLDFLGAEDVRFVIFAPDPGRPYKTVRASGRATLEGVMRIAQPYDVLAWAGATQDVEAKAHEG
jgi:hypothetical protein